MQFRKTMLAPLALVMAVSATAGLQAAETKSATKGEAAALRGDFDPQAIEAKFRSFYTNVVNKQDLSRLDEYVAYNFEEHNPMQGAKAKSGPESVKETFQQIFAAFPDAKIDLDSIVVQGNQAVARYTFTGTQKGAFMNMPASGKKVKVTGFDWATLDTALKATAHWGFMDAASLMQQIGAKQAASAE